MPPIRPIVHSMEGVNAWGFVEVIRSGIVVFILLVSYIYIKFAMKYAYKIVFSVVGLRFFHYVVLRKIDFSTFWKPSF